jgi:hypothetical protein
MSQEQLRALRLADEQGEVADSMEVRKAIMAKFHAGEWPLDQCKAELRRVQREARANGKTLREDFF